jgi:hypothetical protein
VLIENIGSIIRREGACYFFLDKKVTKKSSQQRGFFAARAFPLQSGQNHGLGKFAPCFAAHPMLKEHFTKKMFTSPCAMV